MALLHVNYFSDVLGMSTQMEVVLPQDSTCCTAALAAQPGQESIPVLYLLHGMTDNHTAWTRHTAVERYAAAHGIAVVMPNAHLSWYTDMHLGFQYYTHIAQEVPQICTQFFPQLAQDRAHRFIARNSMGGYGALKIALRNPQAFAGAASLSGCMDIYANTQRPHPHVRSNYWSDIFGDLAALPASDHDLFVLTERFAGAAQAMPKLFLRCGTSDFFYRQNLYMKAHLETLQLPMNYQQGEGGHTWQYWDQQIASVLDWIAGLCEGGIR